MSAATEGWGGMKGSERNERRKREKANGSNRERGGDRFRVWGNAKERGKSKQREILIQREREIECAECKGEKRN